MIQDQTMNQEDQTQFQPQMKFVKMNSINAFATFEGKKQIYNQEEEKHFIQDTQDETTTFSNAMSDESTVDGEDDNLQYIASEILKEKRTYYYQVKKQVVKKMILGTRQTENTKQKRWAYAEEIAFWQLLAKFGTNFDFIAKEMKTKTRKQVMLKFNREDKKNAVQVDQALKGQVPQIFQNETTPEDD